MKSLIVSTAVAALLVAAPALAQTSSSGSMNNPGSTAKPGSSMSTGTASERSADTRFIDHAARGNEAEIALGKLAEQKAQSPEVKSLAQRLVTDHGKANQQLKQLAQKEGVSVPTGPDKEQKDLHARLDKLNGAAFDRAFVDAQVKDHQKDIQFYQTESSRLQDPQLKSFAQQTLPVLQEHLQMAERAESQVGASGSSTSGISKMPSTGNLPSRKPSSR
jgi:putative membrane protein